MGEVSMLLKIAEAQAAADLQAAEQKLSEAGELAIDFSELGRLDAKGVQAVQELAREADEKGVKLVLHGVKVDVYKVLKLVKLDSRFTFAA
ncbi:MAG: STAS domain-containing protein [Acidobacteriaceae bacterium]|nr:STAS domain-containing protein [Acidobacteriaceae bacterium]